MNSASSQLASRLNSLADLVQVAQTLPDTLKSIVGDTAQLSELADSGNPEELRKAYAKILTALNIDSADDESLKLKARELAIIFDKNLPQLVSSLSWLLSLMPTLDQINDRAAAEIQQKETNINTPPDTHLMAREPWHMTDEVKDAESFLAKSHWTQKITLVKNRPKPRAITDHHMLKALELRSAEAIQDFATAYENIDDDTKALCLDDFQKRAAQKLDFAIYKLYIARKAAQDRHDCSDKLVDDCDEVFALKLDDDIAGINHKVQEEYGFDRKALRREALTYVAPTKVRDSEREIRSAAIELKLFERLAFALKDADDITAATTEAMNSELQIRDLLFANDAEATATIRDGDLNELRSQFKLDEILNR